MSSTDQFVLSESTVMSQAASTYSHPLLLRARSLSDEHGRAFTSFGIIGASVFGLGLVLLYIFVHLLHIETSLAFFLQSLIAIEVSFVLNWNLTWKRRHTPFRAAAQRFHVMRLVTIPVNQIIYLGLRGLGVEYLLAMVVTVAIFTAINYIVCHTWTFPDIAHVDVATAGVLEK